MKVQEQVLLAVTTVLEAAKVKKSAIDQVVEELTAMDIQVRKQEQPRVGSISEKIYNELVNTSDTKYAIAKRLDTTNSQVYQVEKRYGLKDERPQPTEKNEEPTVVVESEEPANEVEILDEA